VATETPESQEQNGAASQEQNSAGSQDQNPASKGSKKAQRKRKQESGGGAHELFDRDKSDHVQFAPLLLLQLPASRLMMIMFLFMSATQEGQHDSNSEDDRIITVLREFVTSQ
jgi:hypothetical protein